MFLLDVKILKTAVLNTLRFFLWLSLFGFNVSTFGSTEFSVSAGFDRVFYREYSTEGDTLNTETGYLPSLGLSLVRHVNSVSASMDIYHASSEVNYDGQLQNGLPYRTLSTMRKSSLDWGMRWHVGRQELGIRLGKFRWDRIIQSNQGVSELAEYYSWNRGGVSYKYTGSHFNIQVEVARLFHGIMEVDLTEQSYGVIPVYLPNGIELVVIYEQDLPSLADHWRLGTKFSTHHFPRSEASFSGNIGLIEPENITAQIRFYLSYYFLDQ